MSEQKENTPIKFEVVQSDKLSKLCQETGIEESSALTLAEKFQPTYQKMRAEIVKCAGVAESVKDATCVTEIKRARACRLALRAVRLECEVVHKREKAASFSYGKAVDGFKNILLAEIAPVEQALQDAEDTAERAEAARKALLKAERETDLKVFGVDVSFYQLGDMPADQYAALLESTKLMHKAKIEAAEKALAEKLAKEKVEAEERERIQQDNERLRQEAIVREAAAKAEREKAEKEARELAENAAREQAKIKAEAAAAAKLAEEKAAKERADLEAKAKAERQAREKVEAEARARQEAEAKKAQEADAAAKKAAAAPDREKLLAYAKAIRTLTVPTLATNDGATLEKLCREQAEKFAKWIEGKAKDL